MAKVGDHVDTTHGMGTVISGKRILIHGTKDKIISYEGDKDRDKKKRVIKAVVRTRLQVEEQSTSNHKKFIKAQKASEKEAKAIEKEAKKKEKEEKLIEIPKAKKASPKKIKIRAAAPYDFDLDVF